MNSSGIKRGLAVSAVAALGVVGFPSLANATPISVADSTVVLDSGLGGGILSAQPTTLVAAGGAGVEQVQFAYEGSGDSEFTKIGTPVTANNGVFSFSWNVPAALANTDITIEAQAYGAQDPILDSSSDPVVSDVDVHVSPAADAVTLDQAPGAEIGAFKSTVATGAHYQAIVSGVATDVAAQHAPYVGAIDESGAIVTPAKADYSGNSDDSKDLTNPFSGVVDLGASYTFGTTDETKPDQAVVAAWAGSPAAPTTAPVTGKVVPVSLYEQKITNVTATSDAATAPRTAKPEVTVTVTDQKGSPIAGAVVAAVAGTPAGTLSNGGVTDSHGTVTYKATNTLGSDAQTYSFTTEGYYQRDVTVTPYKASLNKLDVTPTVAGAIDSDEYGAAETITVKGTDQNGNPAQADDTNLNGTWTYTPFNSSKSYTFDAGFTTDSTSGKTTVDNPWGATATNGTDSVTAGSGTYQLVTWVENPAGAPGLDSSDVQSSPLSLKIGKAQVAYDAASKDGAYQVATGSTNTLTGKVVLEDGTALGGRSFHVAVSGTGITAGFTTNQPAGTTYVNKNNVEVKADSTGSFGITVTQPKPTTGAPSEENVTLTATSSSVAADNLLSNSASGANVLALGFVKDLTVTSIALVPDVAAVPGFDGNGDGDYDDTGDTAPVAAQYGRFLGGDGLNEATPGRPVTYTFQAMRGGQPAVGTEVSLSVDHGFFVEMTTDGAHLQPAAEPTSDSDLYGAWKSLGSTTKVTTDKLGRATVTVAVGQDKGFNDDGVVDSKLVAAAGSFSKNIKTTEFTSEDPLNIAGVKIVGDSATLPNAQTGSPVGVSVQVTDQFGNLTSVPVSVANGNDNGDLQQEAPAFSTFTNDDPIYTASSDSAAAQQIAATVPNQTSVHWTDATTATKAFDYAPGSVATDTVNAPVTPEPLTINWYDVDAAATKVVASHAPAGSTAKPGSLITETISVTDQKGNPVSDADVTYFVTGTGNLLHDGDPNFYGLKNNGDGTYTFLFQGPTSGNVVVQASASRTVGGKSAQVGSVASDSITFAKSKPTTPSNAPDIKGFAGTKDLGATDLISVHFDNSWGNPVVLVRGGKVIARGTVKKGHAVFKVKDLNGGKNTTYKVKFAHRAKGKTVTVK